ncbi:MAG: carboxypeptidase regulatory-like domain-containing protein [Gemmatimonadaceae bacterium]|nr:carboxypeptidase regulatory-like domain-containing protein [Gemmatimonadaceae bacterium]
MRSQASAGRAVRRTIMIVAGMAAPVSVLGLAASLTDPLRAQSTAGVRGVVRGVVRDAAGFALSGVEVSIDARSTSVESDSVGRFLIGDVAPGAHVVRARRVGYLPDSATVTLDAGESPSLVLTLSRAAQVLRPVVVEGRNEMVGPMAGFYRRARQGLGKTFTAEDIARRRFVDLPQLLNTVNGVQVSRGRMGQSVIRLRGERDAPEVYLDGIPMGNEVIDLDNFDLATIAGIEIYRGMAMTPPEFMLGRTTAVTAGAIVLWTHEPEPRIKRSREHTTASRYVASLLREGRAYLADEVDAVVQVESGELRRPLYPESLFVADVPGVVLAEYVVDSTGSVIPETFSIVLATHRDFASAVRRAVFPQRFVPARRHGKPVAQLVQQPFEFTPPSQLSGERPQP